jgi:tetratricopeptide (TPR) repeat protein
MAGSGRRLRLRAFSSASTLAVGGAALLAVLVYANSLANGFAYDDVWIIQNRDLVHSFGRLPELLTTDYWPDRFGSGLYRPLTLLTYAIDWQLWGGDPLGFHLVNILLHAAVAGALTALLLRLFPWWGALVGGAVFAVHPVHTEAVANVVGRAELLTALFMISACLIYLDKLRSEDRLGLARTATIAALYVLSMLSKELGVVLPALLLILDIPKLARGGAGQLRAYARSRAPIVITLTAVLLTYLGARWLVLGAPVESVPDRVFIPDASFATRFFTMARVWPRYFHLLFFPTELSADYSPAVILPASQLTPTAVLGIGLVALTGLLAVLGFRRRPEFSAAVTWAAIALLPVSNLVFVAEIVLAERTLYVPSVAVSIIASLAAVATRPRLRRWVVAGLAIWVAGGSVVTVRRNPAWRNTDTVFQDMLEHHPESVRVLWWLGDRHLQRGDWEGAKQRYYRSLEIWPYQGQYLAELAVHLTDHGELAEAEPIAEQAIAMVPNYLDNHILLGVIRLQRNDPAGVLAAAERAREVVGEHALLHRLRADAYEQLGELGNAASAAEEFIHLKGSDTTWQDWLRLARLHAAAGDTGAALRALTAAENLPGADRAALDSLRALLGRSP